MARPELQLPGPMVVLREVECAPPPEQRGLLVQQRWRSAGKPGEQWMEPVTPPFRHGLPQETPPSDPPAPRPAPRPGHGRVWINGGDERTWWASWQDGDGLLESPPGTREEAIEAARRMPAGDRVIFS